MKYPVYLKKVWSENDIQQIDLPAVDANSFEQAFKLAHEKYVKFANWPNTSLVVKRVNNWHDPTIEQVLDFFKEMVACSMWVGTKNVSEMVKLNLDRYGLSEYYSYCMKELK
jgi:hypothetical protein